jgi:hypothetical protein
MQLKDANPSIRPKDGLLRTNGYHQIGDLTVRAECLAEQGVSKHERCDNCGFQVYVLHVFHKKTQLTRKEDIELASARYKQLKEIAK